jgi:hypothetical protein
MSNSLPQILAILGRTEADFHVDDNQMRDLPVTWEQVLALAALVDGIGEDIKKQRDEAQSMCTAWQGVFEGIDAHLQDRVAMNDLPSPQSYLDIIRGDVARLLHESRAIVRSRWADYRRQQDTIANLEAKCAALVDEKTAPITAKDVTDEEVDAAWWAGWGAPLTEFGRHNLRRLIAHVKNRERGHG